MASHDQLQTCLPSTQYEERCGHTLCADRDAARAAAGPAICPAPGAQAALGPRLAHAWCM